MKEVEFSFDRSGNTGFGIFVFLFLHFFPLPSPEGIIVVTVVLHGNYTSAVDLIRWSDAERLQGRD